MYCIFCTNRRDLAHMFIILMNSDFQRRKNYSFLVTFSINAVDVTDGETLVFDEVRINEGNHYDPTTGIYTGTVPVADLRGCKGYPSSFQTILFSFSW